MDSKEKVCRFGHVCTSDCQNTKDCPCQSEHCCALTENCEGGKHCDDHYEEKTDDNQPIDELVEEEPADVCEYCKGEGKVPKLILDNSENMPSGGEWVDSGELETCICRIEK